MPGFPNISLDLHYGKLIYSLISFICLGQLFMWWRKNPDAPPNIISCTVQHSGRTTVLQQARWIDVSRVWDNLRDSVSTVSCTNRFVRRLFVKSPFFISSIWKLCLSICLWPMKLDMSRCLRPRFLWCLGCFILWWSRRLSVCIRANQPTIRFLNSYSSVGRHSMKTNSNISAKHISNICTTAFCY